MTNTATLARPYATAAFEAAKAVNQLPIWSVALKKLSLAVQDKEMSSLLKNPAVTKKQLCDLLSVFAEQKEISNFVKLLAEKKRLRLLPSIFELFEADCAKKSGHIALNVTSAYTMDDAQQKTVTEKLSKQLKSALKIDFHTDENLIGGLLVRSGNWVLDDTIRGKLARLRIALGDQGSGIRNQGSVRAYYRSPIPDLKH